MTQHDVTGFLNRCRDGSGRFVETDEDRPNLEAARFGAEILQLTGSTPTDAELRLVIDCRRGAAYAMDPESDIPVLGACYYALRLLELADHKPDKAAGTADWIVGSVLTLSLIHISEPTRPY